MTKEAKQLAAYALFHDTLKDDAALLAVAQAVEHYEISRYGTLKTWAGELGIDSVVKLLEATPQEEKKTDAALSELAVTVINYGAEVAWRDFSRYARYAVGAWSSLADTETVTGEVSWVVA